MSGNDAEHFSTHCNWPLPKRAARKHRSSAISTSLRSCCVRDVAGMAKEVPSNGVDAKGGLRVPFRRRSQCYEIRSSALKDSDMRQADNRRSLSAVHIRGGAGQQHTGLLGWLRKAKSADHHFGHDSDQPGFRVTYKGKTIGRPQLVSAMQALPPESRFTSLDQDASLEAAVDLSQNHTNERPCGQEHSTFDHIHIARAESPPFLPPPALLTTPSRPATTNPFAGTYGNPTVRRAGQVPLPIDYTIAGSLIDRPSALDEVQGSNTRLPALGRGMMLPNSHQAPVYDREVQCTGGESIRCDVRGDRKWDALPPLPFEEGTPRKSQENAPLRGDVNHSDQFDTEEVLSSLRPERLGLLISIPGRHTNDSTKVDRDFATPQAWSDHHSVRTRDWDLQSCATDDLGVDTRLERQKELTQRAQKNRLSSGRRQQENVRHNHGLLGEPPEKEASTPESLFYTELVAIVRDYQEQLQHVIQRAYEAGEISEDHWLCEKWRHQTTLERRLQAAESISGYRIFTTESDIKEAIAQPTGYAIYSSLLQIRDPATWQRIFGSAASRPSSAPATAVPQRNIAQETSLSYIARKVGRAFRFMLAVPDDPSLKTYSSRHPQAIETLSYSSPFSALPSNVPSRPYPTLPNIISNPLPLQPRQYTTSTSADPRPSLQTDRPSKFSNDTTRVNGNTVLTGNTLVSPLNGRCQFAPGSRGRGYEQGGFVTVVAPSVVSKASDKVVGSYEAGRVGDDRNIENRESAVTTWPELEWWREV